MKCEEWYWNWLHNVTGCMFFSSVPVCLAESMPFSVGLWRCWSSSSTKAWSPNSTGCSQWRAGRKRNPGAFFGFFWCFDSDRKWRKFRNTPEYWVCQSCQVNGATFVLGQNLSSKHLSGDGASRDGLAVFHGVMNSFSHIHRRKHCAQPSWYIYNKSRIDLRQENPGNHGISNEQNRLFLSSANMEGKAWFVASSRCAWSEWILSPGEGLFGLVTENQKARWAARFSRRGFLVELCFFRLSRGLGRLVLQKEGGDESCEANQHETAYDSITNRRCVSAQVDKKGNQRRLISMAMSFLLFLVPPLMNQAAIFQWSTFGQ